MSTKTTEPPVIVIDEVADESNELPEKATVDADKPDTSVLIDIAQIEADVSANDLNATDSKNAGKVTLTVPVSDKADVNHVDPEPQGASAGKARKTVRIESPGLKHRKRHHSSEEDLKHLTEDVS